MNPLLRRFLVWVLTMLVASGEDLPPLQVRVEGRIYKVRIVFEEATAP